MALREQNDGMVWLGTEDGPLPTLFAWANSSAVYWFRPPFPCGEMYLKVGKADGTAWNDGIRMTCHVKRGLFRAYVPPSVFTAKAETRYQVVCVDGNGSRHVCGEGLVRVRASAIPDTTEVLQKCILPFTDGMGRYVTVREDDSGALAFAFSEGEVTLPVGTPSVYAYCRSTGFFHLVSGVYDENGNPTASVAAENSEDGFDSFVPDETTGFYRRVTATVDEAGETALSVGEKRI